MARNLVNVSRGFELWSDRNVPFSETVHLVEALRNQGVEFEQLIFPDEIHDFLRDEDWLRAYRASADFLDRHLKSRNR